MPFVYDSSLTISEYLESLYSKHLTLSGSTPIYGQIDNLDSVLNTDNNGDSTRFIVSTYNNNTVFGSSYRGRRFRGTKDFPSGVLKGDTILHFAGDGYAGTGIKENAGVMLFQAAEDWTGNGNGSLFRLRLTKSGESFLTDRIWINDNGNIGFSNTDPQYLLDGSGAANFTLGVYSNKLLLATTVDLFNVSGALNTKIVGGVGLTQLVADTLYYSISNPSGFINSSALVATGNLLNNKILTLSGQTLFSSQTGQFYSIQNVNNYVTSGDTGHFVGDWQTGRFYSIDNLNQYVNSGTTGILTGSFYPRFSNPGGFITQSQTGLFYSNSNPSGFLTGINTGNFYPSNYNPANYLTSIPAQYITTAQTGQFQVTGNYILTNQTGGFYPNYNPNNYLHSGNTGNLISNWQTGRFYGIENVNQFVVSGVTGNLTGSFYPLNSNPSSYLTTAQTGRFYDIANFNNYSTSGNLYSTGNIILGQITSLSGDFTGSSASSSGKFTTLSGNLIQTGINLLNQINGTGNFYRIENVNNFSTSGNLYITGSNLDNKISVLSGQIVFTNQTGGFYRDNINFYATSGNLYQSGANLLNNSVTISGKVLSLSGDLISHVAADLTGINISGGNSLFGLVKLTGISNIDISQSGQTIVFSGVNLSNYLNRSETGGFYPAYNPTAFAASGDLFNTGTNLFTNDTIISGKQISLSGDLLSTGANLLSRLILNSGNLTQTGINLLNTLSQVRITGSNTILIPNFMGGGNVNVSLSGISTIIISGNIEGFSTTGSNDLRYYSITNPNQYVNSGVTGALTGNFPTRAETGKFYQNNINSYSMSGDLTSASGVLRNQIISLSGDLGATGINLYTSGVKWGFIATADAPFTPTTAGLTGVSLIGAGIGNLTFPANFLTVGKTLKFRADGVFTTSAVPGAINFYSTLAGTTILTTEAFSPTINITTPRGWWTEGVITCRSTGVSGSVMAQGQTNVMNTVTPIVTTSPVTWMMTNTGVSGVNTISGLTFGFKATSTSTGIRMSGTNFILEVL